MLSAEPGVGAYAYLVDRGPAEASTCHDLVPYGLPVVYDTNGYYRALGVRPDATRREIREAYMARGGMDDARLTEIAKVLLNPQRRAQYDSVPLGGLFYDSVIEDWQRRRRVDEVIDLIRQGYAEMADKLADADLGVSLDDLLLGRQDEPSLEPVWGWGYYLDASRFARDVDRLRQWQELLVSHLGRRGEQVRIAVGFSGVMATFWGVEQIGQHLVVFLHDEARPTEALAQAAASRVVQHLNPDREPVPVHSHGDEKKMSGFRKGTEAAKEASKAGANFARTEFFKLDDGKSTLLRFLTEPDDLIVVDQHQMVPTKKKPFAGWPKDAKWAEKRGAVCRRDPALDYDECYICDHIVDGKKVKKASARNWALACVREEVREGGQIVGYKDATREVKITRDGKEETVVEKKIVVVNMGYKNFFSILSGFAGRYGTLLDRDYFIQREGDDTSTIYHIVPNDPIKIDGPNGVEVFDLRQPYFMERYKHDINLEEVIKDLATDEFYAKFFDPRVTVVEEKDGDKHVGYKVVPADSTEAAQAMAAAKESGESAEVHETGVDAERLAALAGRVKSYGPGGRGDDAEAAPAAEEPAKAPEASGESEGEQKEPASTGASTGGMRDFG